MQPTLEELTAAVTSEAARELDAATDVIAHCLAQLTDEQVWWRPDERLNSIANLLLHLNGNLQQWIVAGIGGAEDVRRRHEEFSLRGPMPKEELTRRLMDAVNEAKQALSGTSADELLRLRRIQGFEVTGMAAIFHSVAHFRGHAQEIVHFTRRQMGAGYRFKFVPSGPEQGAAPNS